MEKLNLIPALLLLLASFASQAAIIETSLNPAVSPGLVAYVDNDDGWPTPQQDPTVYSALPASQTIFAPYDPIRIAQSISLADLNQATDDNGLSSWDLSSLLWVVEWWSPSAVTSSTPTGYNTVAYAWADASADLANGLTQTTFFTDLYIPNTFAPLEVGQWYVQSYFENDTQYRGPISFRVVPEPATLFLICAGLATFAFSSARNNKRLGACLRIDNLLRQSVKKKQA